MGQEGIVKLKEWQVFVPAQVALVAHTKEEAQSEAKRLFGDQVKYEVSRRTHDPEQCWCGDDHSP